MRANSRAVSYLFLIAVALCGDLRTRFANRAAMLSEWSESSQSHAPDFSLPDANGNVVTLSQFRDRNRLVLLFPASDGVAREFLARVEAHADEFDARDLIALIILANDYLTTTSPYVRVLIDTEVQVRERFEAQNGAFYLLGKAGFPVAMARREVSDFAEVFAKIDAMPMRQQEMRERGR